MFAPDGSLTIVIETGGRAAFADGGESQNSIVAPEGPFSLYLRLYAPEDNALNGLWTPPPDATPRRIAGRARTDPVQLLFPSRRVPLTAATFRRKRLGDVIAARRRRANRVSWCAIFIKAYGIVAAARPELRRCYLPWIWPHLYEHPINVASFTLERLHDGEPGVFFAKVPRPEGRSLRELDDLGRWYQSAPVDAVPSFSQTLLLSRLQRPLRRLAWTIGLISDGACRAHFFGTFGMSVVGSLGAAGLHILSPLTTTLNYGTFDDDGGLDVRIT